MASYAQTHWAQIPSAGELYGDWGKGGGERKFNLATQKYEIYSSFSSWSLSRIEREESPIVTSLLCNNWEDSGIGATGIVACSQPLRLKLRGTVYMITRVVPLINEKFLGSGSVLLNLLRLACFARWSSIQTFSLTRFHPS